MTLRQDYYSGSSGIEQAMSNAFTAGSTFVTTNLTLLSTELQSAASQGKTQFVVVIPTSYQPTVLRLEGLILEAYLAGIQQALAGQSIYDFECDLTLNTSDLSTTSINFEFHFQVA